MAVLAANATAQVRVENAWMRNMVPGQYVAGAFMKITAEESGKLLGFSSPIVTAIEMHETSMSNNVMKMRAVDNVDLHAGKSIEFKTGASHLMLYGVKKKLIAGEEIPFSLKFEDKDKRVRNIDFKMKVREPFLP